MGTQVPKDLLEERGKPGGKAPVAERKELLDVHMGEGRKKKEQH